MVRRSSISSVASSPPPYTPTSTGAHNISLSAPLPNPRTVRHTHLQDLRPTETSPLIQDHSKISPSRGTRRILVFVGAALLVGILTGFFTSYSFFSTSARLERVNRAWQRLDAHRDAVNQDLVDTEKRLAQARQRLKDAEDEERHQKDEIVRMKLYWGTLEHDSHCLAYGTKDYSAQLMNLPQDRDYDAIKACKSMSMSINGVEYKTPSWCSAEWDGAIVGHWRVTNDLMCKPWWSRLTDKGCTAQRSGMRRWEQHMENLYAHDDWAQICESTPADFNGKYFDKPTYCANWGHHGIFGVWIVEDDWCR